MSLAKEPKIVPSLLYPLIEIEELLIIVLEFIPRREMKRIGSITRRMRHLFRKHSLFDTCDFLSVSKRIIMKPLQENNYTINQRIVRDKILFGDGIKKTETRSLREWPKKFAWQNQTWELTGQGCNEVFVALLPFYTNASEIAKHVFKTFSFTDRYLLLCLRHITGVPSPVVCGMHISVQNMREDTELMEIVLRSMGNEGFVKLREIFPYMLRNGLRYSKISLIKLILSNEEYRSKMFTSNDDLLENVMKALYIMDFGKCNLDQESLTNLLSLIDFKTESKTNIGRIHDFFIHLFRHGTISLDIFCMFVRKMEDKDIKPWHLAHSIAVPRMIKNLSDSSGEDREKLKRYVLPVLDYCIKNEWYIDKDSTRFPRFLSTLDRKIPGKEFKEVREKMHIILGNEKKNKKDKKTVEKEL